MAKNIVVYIFAFVLLIAIALGCVAVFKIGKGISDSFDTLFVTDTQTDSGTNSDTGVSTESETVTDAIAPHSLALGSDKLEMVIHTDINQGIANVGFKTDDLKPNTSYKMYWLVNTLVSVNTEFDFQGDSSSGSYQEFVCYNTHYLSDNPCENTHNVFYASREVLCKNIDGVEFVTGDTGDTFSVFFFQIYWDFDEYESYEYAMKMLNQECSEAMSYIGEFYIEEVVG